MIITWEDIKYLVNNEINNGKSLRLNILSNKVCIIVYVNEIIGSENFNNESDFIEVK